MPDIGAFHPQIVHFVVALLVVGVALRWVSLTGKLAFTRPAAATLLLLGTLAAVAAVRSGLDAHEAVERVPGVAAAVNAHEQWAKNTRTIFLVVSGLEVVALALALLRLPTFRRWVEVASAVVGLGGGYLLYGAADRGGDLVYSYAGGVGIRTGDSADVDHLLVAGLFERAMLARKQHQSGAADTLITELARLHPSDPNVRLVHAQSLLLDRKDPQAALAILDSIVVPDSLASLRGRVAFQKVDALLAAGMADSARATLTALGLQFAGNPRMSARIQERLKEIK
jgi:uncharacterized membrane protein